MQFFVFFLLRAQKNEFLMYLHINILIMPIFDEQFYNSDRSICIIPSTKSSIKQGEFYCRSELTHVIISPVSVWMRFMHVFN